MGNETGGARSNIKKEYEAEKKLKAKRMKNMMTDKRKPGFNFLDQFKKGVRKKNQQPTHTIRIIGDVHESYVCTKMTWCFGVEGKNVIKTLQLVRDNSDPEKKHKEIIEVIINDEPVVFKGKTMDDIQSEKVELSEKIEFREDEIVTKISANDDSLKIVDKSWGLSSREYLVRNLTTIHITTNKRTIRLGEGDEKKVREELQTHGTSRVEKIRFGFNQKFSLSILACLCRDE